MKSVRDELAEALRVTHAHAVYHGLPCGASDAALVALTRHRREPDDRPLLLALLRAAREWESCLCLDCTHGDNPDTGESLEGKCQCGRRRLLVAIDACASIMVPEEEA